MTGKVIRLFQERGFGFLRDEHGLSRFFHANDILDGDFETLKVGDVFEFTPTSSGQGGNGLRAEALYLVC